MPQKEEGEADYKLGLYIRDSAAGIGTMTFYHPEIKKIWCIRACHFRYGYKKTNRS